MSSAPSAQRSSRIALITRPHDGTKKKTRPSTVKKNKVCQMVQRHRVQLSRSRTTQWLKYRSSSNPQHQPMTNNKKHINLCTSRAKTFKNRKLDLRGTHSYSSNSRNPHLLFLGRAQARERSPPMQAGVARQGIERQHQCHSAAFRQRLRNTKCATPLWDWSRRSTRGEPLRNPANCTTTVTTSRSSSTNRTSYLRIPRKKGRPFLSTNN